MESLLIQCQFFELAGELKPEAGVVVLFISVAFYSVFCFGF